LDFTVERNEGLTAIDLLVRALTRRDLMFKLKLQI